ncbi:virulence factor [Xylophilus ampelinus]|uniref:Virulence-associated protein VapD n=1 Tax=Xylophilus ampelinus TaxID=54067 RepID=A0A318SJE1_9BURK|nr:virulence factor [Xylophilus ampelinus]MCS4510944.1 virulence factor [Xylophilus ampelinus]PYE76104.1 virulence-associated protein VapD [Xylophilus ampelinus]
MGYFDSAVQNLLEQVPLPQQLPKESGRMYAIAFDLDTQALQAAYPGPSYNNAYGEIKKILVARGFAWQQGSVYFGNETITAVQCVLSAQALSAALPWFKASVRDLRMLRIEELNDLIPAL